MEKHQIEQLFRQYADDVFRLSMSYLGNRQDAEDICQSVFLKLIHKNVTLLPGKEKAWLLTCAANACKNHLRSFWKRNVTQLDPNIPAPSEDHYDLYRAVLQLPVTYRGVVHLYYYEGYDQGEIARILGLSRTAVQTRMDRARAILRKELSCHEKDLL